MTAPAPARVPPPWTAIVAIGLNTFREAIRDRVLYLLFVFAVVVIGASRLLALLTVGSEDKIIKDLGLSAISIFGVMTAGFTGVSLVFKEIERRTVYTLLANPVRRWQFVTGKYVGLMAVLALNVVLMYAALAVLLWIRGENPLSLAPAVLLIGVELAVVTAFALLFSSLTNPILAAVWTFVVYVTGHLVWSLRLLGDKLPAGVGRGMCEALYWILPNLDRMNVRAEVVHGVTLPSGFVPISTVYGLSYAVVVLALASLALERKDFT